MTDRNEEARRLRELRLLRDERDREGEQAARGTAGSVLTVLALLLCGLVALNPAMAFLSGGWGQIDQVLTLALLLAVWLLTENRLEWAGLAYGIAILIKPQALMAGPLFAGVYFVKIHDQDAKTALRTLAAVALAVGIILLLCVPFSGGQGTVEVDAIRGRIYGRYR